MSELDGKGPGVRAIAADRNFKLVLASVFALTLVFFVAAILLAVLIDDPSDQVIGAIVGLLGGKRLD